MCFLEPRGRNQNGRPRDKGKAVFYSLLIFPRVDSTFYGGSGCERDILQGLRTELRDHCVKPAFGSETALHKSRHIKFQFTETVKQGVEHTEITLLHIPVSSQALKYSVPGSHFIVSHHIIPASESHKDHTIKIFRNLMP